MEVGCQPKVDVHLSGNSQPVRCDKIPTQSVSGALGRVQPVILSFCPLFVGGHPKVDVSFEWKQNSQCIAKDLHSVNQWGLGLSRALTHSFSQCSPFPIRHPFFLTCGCHPSKAWDNSKTHAENTKDWGFMPGCTYRDESIEVGWIRCEPEDSSTNI